MPVQIRVTVDQLASKRLDLGEKLISLRLRGVPFLRQRLPFL